MERSSFSIEGRDCIVYADRDPEALLLIPVDGNGKDTQDELVKRLSEMTGKPYTLAAFKVAEWNGDLSPWQADAVFKGNPFAGRGEGTLEFVLNVLINDIRERYSLKEDIPIILGGYSLAGLFSLWASYKTDVFSAIAAASPSVWYEGWPEFTEGRSPQTGFIYLSLGDKEEKTGNRAMARVGDRIRAQYEGLTSQGIPCELEWNEGNHFKDVNIRLAKGFSRCMESI